MPGADADTCTDLSGGVAETPLHETAGNECDYGDLAATRATGIGDGIAHEAGFSSTTVPVMAVRLREIIGSTVRRARHC